MDTFCSVATVIVVTGVVDVSGLKIATMSIVDISTFVATIFNNSLEH
jgi:hypothetical protein